MYRLMLVCHGRMQQLGGDVGTLQETLRQIEGIKAALQGHKITDTQELAGLVVDDYKIFIMDAWGKPIPAVKYKKEEE